MLQKISFILNKCCYFQLSIQQKILKKSVSKKILHSMTVFNIDNNNNVSWAANQYVRMISEGSCDT